MNLATIILALVVFGVFALITWRGISNIRSGKSSCSCGGSCKSCAGCCGAPKQVHDPEK